MAYLRIRKLPLALVILLLATGTATAQRFQPFGPVDFSHDLQPFAPAEISSYGGGPDANVGYFFTYDRMNMYVSRGNPSVARHLHDDTWGNRIDFGYMSEADHGWLVELIHIDGPSVVLSRTEVETPTADVPNRTNFVGPAENVARMSSVEVMKQWRFKPLHRGSVVEGFAGFRYTDIYTRDNWPITTLNDTITETRIHNYIFGPQIGLRWFKQKGRWLLSSEGRYYYGYNNQDFSQTLETRQTSVAFQEHRWVHAGDVRLEATYEFTKSFAVSVGCDMLYFGNGIARGAGPFVDQDIAFAGWTFGFKLNR